MLDEPMQGLATIIVQQLADTLIALKGRFAMIVVEQNQSFLKRFIDKISYIHGGALQSDSKAP
jgi:ABC-type branched-subunit amino acid transport system ATPase component